MHPQRGVIMHVLIDGQHAVPLRRALVRDCGDQSWTIRLVPLQGTQRMRLSLYLPQHAMDKAMKRVAEVAPDAKVDQLLEVPEDPTRAWRALVDGQRRSAASSSGGHLQRLLDLDHVHLEVALPDRDALTAYLGSVLAARHGLSAEEVSAAFESREQLGSTGLGQGLAVPHGRLAGLDRPIAVYVRPVEPLLFDAPDGQPVSDIVAFLVPDWDNSSHLHLLAEVAQRFSDHGFRERLRGCADARAVITMFADAGEPAQLTAMRRRA